MAVNTIIEFVIINDHSLHIIDTTHHNNPPIIAMKIPSGYIFNALQKPPTINMPVASHFRYASTINVLSVKHLRSLQCHVHI